MIFSFHVPALGNFQKKVKRVLSKNEAEKSIFLLKSTWLQSQNLKYNRWMGCLAVSPKYTQTGPFPGKSTTALQKDPQCPAALHPLRDTPSYSQTAGNGFM